MSAAKVSVSLPNGVRERINALAKRTGVSFHDVLRACVVQGVEAAEDPKRGVKGLVGSFGGEGAAE